jgi:hypothetical protein
VALVFALIYEFWTRNVLHFRIMALTLAPITILSVAWSCYEDRRLKQQVAALISQVRGDADLVVGSDEDIEEGRVGGGDAEVDVAKDESNGEIELSGLSSTVTGLLTRNESSPVLSFQSTFFY